MTVDLSGKIALVTGSGVLGSRPFVDGQYVRVIGETGLLETGVRSATVRCSSEVTALRLSRDDFDRLLLELPCWSEARPR